jgi:hypothetical protein
MIPWSTEVRSKLLFITSNIVDHEHSFRVVVGILHPNPVATVDGVGHVTDVTICYKYDDSFKSAYNEKMTKYYKYYNAQHN